MKLPIKAEGVALHDEKGFLSINYHSFSESSNQTNGHSLKGDMVTTHLIKDEPISDIPTAWLKLYLLSLRHFQPNQLNLDNIFSVLPNLAWTDKGPKRIEVLKSTSDLSNYRVYSIDKFPPMTDYVVPEGVRIADCSRVRLGAFLGKGTTIMHEGFVNYNAGTEGPNMVEGRISAGVFVKKNSDLGGGSSTMGTL